MLGSLTQTFLAIRHWPHFTREAKLTAYRRTRDQIEKRILDRFGPPDEPAEVA